MSAAVWSRAGLLLAGLTVFTFVVVAAAAGVAKLRGRLRLRRERAAVGRVSGLHDLMPYSPQERRRANAEFWAVVFAFRFGTTASGGELR